MNQMLRPAQSHESIPLEALAGTVERVTYHNAENGFCVLKVQVRGKRDLVVVVGHTPSVGAGEWITASGAWVSDRTHGLQFKAGVLKCLNRFALPSRCRGAFRTSNGSATAGPSCSCC